MSNILIFDGMTNEELLRACWGVQSQPLQMLADRLAEVSDALEELEKRAEELEKENEELLQKIDRLEAENESPPQWRIVELEGRDE